MAAYRRAPIEELTTERLRLRPVAAEDATRIQALFPHPNVLRYMSATIPWPYPEDGAARFVERSVAAIESQDEYVWAVLRRGAEAEGLVGIVGLSPGGETSHRGLWLAEEFWGRGYMREAAEAVTAFAFETLEMAELRLDNAAPNLASHRLKASAGAEIVQIGEGDFVGGRFPIVRWRLTAERWRAARESSREKP